LVLIAMAAALGVSGCGYHPLYADRSAVGGINVAGQLANVKIAGIADRRGQMIRNFLLDRMNPSGEPADPRYILTVTTTENIAITDTRADGTATRSDLRITAHFSLRDTRSDVTVYIDQTEALGTFNLLTARFSSTVSEQETRRRVAEQVADQITRLVALFINRRSRPHPAAKPS
jgi:LPS-assembly lipoprotein